LSVLAIVIIILTSVSNIVVLMLPEQYQKKSFYQFQVPIDLTKLRKEFNAISDDAWATSYWGEIHCSIGMLLLRGGVKGTEEDFFSEQIEDTAVLQQLPYIKSLLDASGPFGQASYAFIFKTQPNGLTLKHQDMMEQWRTMFRVHVPIYTNEGAFLIADERSQHFAEGSAWSFDNHSDHGVVNGDQERVHLIFDIPFNPKMAAQIDGAIHHIGSTNLSHIKLINTTDKARVSYPGDARTTQAINSLKKQGMDAQKIVALFNQNKVPTKFYNASSWTLEQLQTVLEGSAK
jgi:hypothetical protein